MAWHGLLGRQQQAVVWLRIGTDDSSMPIVNPIPVQLDVRWDDSQRVVPGPDGVPIQIDATIVVDRDLPFGSSVWKGAMANLPGTAQLPRLDLMEVKSKMYSPNHNGKQVYREIGLIRVRNVLGATS